MAGSLPSEQIELLVAGYVLGDLDAEEAEEFQRLLATDPAIAQAVAQMQDALELPFAPSDVVPPAHMREVILKANRASHANQASADPSLFSARQFPIRLRQILELLAAGLIIALAINNYQLRQSQQASQSPIPSQNRLTYALRSTTPDLPAAATVAVDPNSLEGTLTVKNLPPLPPGKVYALWTVLKPGAPFTTDPKNAILTNVFQVDAQGNAAQALAVCDVHRSREWVAAVAVTVEDAAAPQKHQSKPILIAAL